MGGNRKCPWVSPENPVPRRRARALQHLGDGGAARRYVVVQQLDAFWGLKLQRPPELALQRPDRADGQDVVEVVRGAPGGVVPVEQLQGLGNALEQMRALHRRVIRDASAAFVVGVGRARGVQRVAGPGHVVLQHRENVVLADEPPAAVAVPVLRPAAAQDGDEPHGHEQPVPGERMEGGDGVHWEGLEALHRCVPPPPCNSYAKVPN